jgi:UV DNA damage endonuclease
VDYRLGYIAQCLSGGWTTSHTCRIANATPQRLEQLIAKNLSDLEKILTFNESQQIFLFRIGSSLVPYASHPVNRLPWWNTFEKDFAAIGELARRSGQRLSLHPSPAAASLSSYKENVQKAALAELRYSSQVLDLLGQDLQARVVVHLGGAQPSKPVALENAHRFLEGLPFETSRRLALENDDRVWTAREVLSIAKNHGLPMVADSLHNQVLPSSPQLSLAELIHLASQTWSNLGLRPKYHLASQQPATKPGTHAPWVALQDAQEIIFALDCPADFILEAKEKDRALFALRLALR